MFQTCSKKIREEAQQTFTALTVHMLDSEKNTEKNKSGIRREKANEQIGSYGGSKSEGRCR